MSVTKPTKSVVTRQLLVYTHKFFFADVCVDNYDIYSIEVNVDILNKFGRLYATIIINCSIYSKYALTSILL